MAWAVHIDDVAKKGLRRLPAKEVTHIQVALREFESNPYSGDIEKLSGQRFSWRRRVGSYRIFYDVLVSQHIVFITKIKRRGSNTY